MEKNQTRLDASESIFFARQLEAIDPTIYDVAMAGLLARDFIPRVANVGPWDREYTYRMYEMVGHAKIAADKATDAPAVQVKASEVTTKVLDIEDMFAYSLSEIRAAMQKGIPLDNTLALSAARAIAEKEEYILAFGDTPAGIKGFANSDSIVDYTTFSPTDKTGSTDYLWTVDGAQPLQILKDITNIVRQVRTALKQTTTLPNRVTLLLPETHYGLIVSTPVSDLATRSIYDFAISNPMIESIQPWHRLTGAKHGGGGDRMIAYVRSPMVLGAVIPLDFMRQPEQPKGLTYEIPCLSRCGGTVIRYPVAMAYGDGI